MKKNPLMLLLLAVLLPQLAHSQGHAGRGLSYVKSAWNLEQGYLAGYAHSRFYGKVSPVITGNPPTAITYWNVQGGFAFNYGISEHVEVGLNQIIYQDNHAGGKGYNLLDDLLLSVKLGSFGQRGSGSTYGFDVITRFPVAGNHNLAFEPYRSNRVSFGFDGKYTYAVDPIYPEDGTTFHLNLGYWNHNDNGQQLTPASPQVDLTRVQGATQEFRFATGMVFPTDRFEFSLEMFGTLFLSQPPATAYGRENFAYIVPKIRYKALLWLDIDMGVDLRLWGGQDETNYQFLSGTIAQFPNYPTWRINLGTRVTLLPISIYSINDRDILMKKAVTRRELFEKIIREQRESASAEEELARIKEERRKAEQELDRLRQILEGSKAARNGESAQEKKKDEPPPD